MNYTKTIREYCLQYKGGVFDIHRELVDHFPACKLCPDSPDHTDMLSLALSPTWASPCVGPST